MQYVLTPYSTNMEPFAWWEGAFTNEELDWLQTKAKNAKQKAQIGGNGEGAVNNDIRRSEVNWMSNCQENEWVFSRLAHVVSSLNAKFFGFDLTGFGEPIQLTTYDESEKGMYGWHVDMGPHTTTPSRKLSIVMQLSDSVEYEGGVLELQPYGKDIFKMKKQRGLIIAFPSWTLHQVTPVTQGTRHSLVTWISGPPFK